MQDETAIGRKVSQRVQAFDELIVVAQLLQRDLPHACHDPHVQDHVGRVGDLNADLGDFGVGWTHDVRHHVHDAALHGSVVQRPNLGFGVLRGHPVVGRSGVIAGLGADKGKMLYAGNVVGVASSQKTAGVLFLVQAGEVSLGHEFSSDAVVLFLRSVAPNDGIRFRQLGDFFDPLLHCLVHPLCSRMLDPLILVRSGLLGRDRNDRSKHGRAKRARGWVLCVPDWSVGAASRWRGPEDSCACGLPPVRCCPTGWAASLHCPADGTRSL